MSLGSALRDPAFPLSAAVNNLPVWLSLDDGALIQRLHTISSLVGLVTAVFVSEVL